MRTASVWLAGLLWAVAALAEQIPHAAASDPRVLLATYRDSEVYKVVEDVEGVENSDCEITLLAAADMATRPQRVVTQSVEGREIAQTIIPMDRQVVYLDPDWSTLKVTAEQYEL